MDARMEVAELAKIISIVAFDIGISEEMERAFPWIWRYIAPPYEYYSLNTDWFSTSTIVIDIQTIIEMLEIGENLDEDFSTYLTCLMELHKRRRKYGLILQRQPLPTMVQVSPRALMEYGPDFPPEALASWLTWRKFFYDLDNRSAQETGYLFEPILAAAIGGEPKSAREKVVRRSEDATKGRQVDCWKIQSDGRALAYELKLRVTIAASGQGRFAEELSFARDCRNSGAIPVLVVLDPTENNKLTGLQDAYRREGGHAFIGDDAWRHLEDQAGRTMASFIERYVREPVERVSSFENALHGDASRRSLVLHNLTARLEGADLCIQLGHHERRIQRHEDPSLADEDSEDE